MKRLAIAALLGCVVQFATVHAQESSGPLSAPTPTPAPADPAPPDPVPPAPPAAESGRYTFHRIQDSVVRLDARTGQVATCTGGPAGFVCQAAPEDRAALEAEIGRLQADNAALKKELLARGLPLPGGVRPDPAPQAPPVPPVAEAPPRPPQPVPAPKSPMETELERVKTLIGDVWRRLVEMVAELQRDIQRKS